VQYDGYGQFEGLPPPRDGTSGFPDDSVPAVAAVEARAPIG